MMTPELPRAPMRAPVVMAFRASAPEDPMGRRAMLVTTLSMVRDMFVPVSPSGTGEHVQAVDLFFACAERLARRSDGVQHVVR